MAEAERKRAKASHRRKSDASQKTALGKTGQSLYSQRAHNDAIQAILAGASVEEAALLANTSPATLRYWRQVHPKFAADWADAMRALVGGRMLDAIERRTQLVNDWIDEVLTGRAVTTRRKYENGMLLWEETTSLPPDRYLIGRILGEAPKAPEVFEVTVGLALPSFEEEEEEGDDA